jgi:hypothetical protein
MWTADGADSLMQWAMGDLGRSGGSEHVLAGIRLKILQWTDVKQALSMVEGVKIDTVRCSMSNVKDDTLLVLANLTYTTI